MRLRTRMVGATALLLLGLVVGVQEWAEAPLRAVHAAQATSAPVPRHARAAPLPTLRLHGPPPARLAEVLREPSVRGAPTPSAPPAPEVLTAAPIASSSLASTPSSGPAGPDASAGRRLPAPGSTAARTGAIEAVDEAERFPGSDDDALDPERFPGAPEDAAERERIARAVATESGEERVRVEAGIPRAGRVDLRTGAGLETEPGEASGSHDAVSARTAGEAHEAMPAGELQPAPTFAPVPAEAGPAEEHPGDREEPAEPDPDAAPEDGAQP
ncbi:hypothetical protein FGE12_17555 [Aggregicoccus sp. 17bor-14]|uniref:hypothetical protein n=1 Tax=Myxococcaceae TaxID=31 RepID=UPI00129C5E9A|nr:MULTISPECIES: hypothetical protein [Myxococcaceae]MBF5044208.1 hypothetical protein [Simulacricoccus sp. 17bor-14]MRI89958.1 hypothetical protein [Aggregicoccus sp. 17bor-14]